VYTLTTRYTYRAGVRACDIHRVDVQRDVYRVAGSADEYTVLDDVGPRVWRDVKCITYNSYIYMRCYMKYTVERKYGETRASSNQTVCDGLT
jgi:hypothetical protein